jgi:hypothetical protein
MDTTLITTDGAGKGQTNVHIMMFCNEKLVTMPQKGIR